MWRIEEGNHSDLSGVSSQVWVILVTKQLGMLLKSSEGHAPQKHLIAFDDVFSPHPTYISEFWLNPIVKYWPVLP